MQNNREAGTEMRREKEGREEHRKGRGGKPRSVETEWLLRLTGAQAY